MLRLNRPLRRTSNADPEDVLAAKHAFASLGLYEPPTGEFHRWPDAPLFEAIESFQVDNDLDPDGEMLPGGPTESALNEHKRSPDNSMPAHAKVAGRYSATQSGALTASAQGAARPVNRSRCLDSCEAGGKVLENFCRALKSKAAREGCWRMTNAGVTACRNWRHNHFDPPEE